MVRHQQPTKRLTFQGVRFHALSRVNLAVHGKTWYFTRVSRYFTRKVFHVFSPACYLARKIPDRHCCFPKHCGFLIFFVTAGLHILASACLLPHNPPAPGRMYSTGVQGSFDKCTNLVKLKPLEPWGIPENQICGFTPPQDSAAPCAAMN